MKTKQEVRRIFIYLMIIAAIAGIVGIVIIEKNSSVNNLSGKAINEKNNNFYSKEEISQHNTERDCWIYLENRVYDITLLLQIYPYDLKQECGKELQLEFSQDDIKILDDYEIGLVEQKALIIF